jgi:hypothetical protein
MGGFNIIKIFYKYIIEKKKMINLLFIFFLFFGGGFGYNIKKKKPATG